MELIFISSNALANRGQGTEVKRDALHRPQLACGNEGRIHRRKARRMNLELLLQDCAFALTSNIEIGVVRQVHHGGLVRGGRILNPYPVIVQRVANSCGERSMTSLL